MLVSENATLLLTLQL